MLSDYTTKEIKDELERRLKVDSVKFKGIKIKTQKYTKTPKQKSTLHPMTIKIIKDTKLAIKQFGEYPFRDKGPHEVMNIGNLIARFDKMSISDVAKVLSELLDQDNFSEYSKDVVGALIGDMDYRDDFETLFVFDNRFEY